ncbi:putative protein FAM47C isoform X1 [Elephas maximus indicus]|uniref:putative protein FAM47C isoform X1 n=1 Tax=Elephas maximus indicus TaxID=99487 RepID=UPI0021160576|nr:putative protein FAM47C isoform X1 [Elephas maximus indicus]
MMFLITLYLWQGIINHAKGRSGSVLWGPGGWAFLGTVPMLHLARPPCCPRALQPTGSRLAALEPLSLQASHLAVCPPGAALEHLTPQAPTSLSVPLVPPWSPSARRLPPRCLSPWCRPGAPQPAGSHLAVCPPGAALEPLSPQAPTSLSVPLVPPWSPSARRLPPRCLSPWCRPGAPQPAGSHLAVCPPGAALEPLSPQAPTSLSVPLVPPWSPSARRLPPRCLSPWCCPGAPQPAGSHLAVCPPGAALEPLSPQAPTSLSVPLVLPWSPSACRCLPCCPSPSAALVSDLATRPADPAVLYAHPSMWALDCATLTIRRVFS